MLSRRRPRHHRIGEARQAGAGQRRRWRGRAPSRASATRAAFGSGRHASDALGQPAQAEQEQHGGDDLDQQLGQREVGRREPDEGEAGDKARAAEQHQRGEAVELGLPGGADRAGAADHPDQREAPDRHASGRPPRTAAGAEQQRSRAGEHSDQRRAAAAAAAGAGCRAGARARAPSATTTASSGRSNDAPAVESADERRAPSVAACRRC